MVRAPKSSGLITSTGTTDTGDPLAGQVVQVSFGYARGQYIGPATVVGATPHGSLRVLPAGWAKPICIGRDEITVQP